MSRAPRGAHELAEQLPGLVRAAALETVPAVVDEASSAVTDVVRGAVRLALLPMRGPVLLGVSMLRNALSTGQDPLEAGVGPRARALLAATTLGPGGHGKAV